ncbi:hypothetical protein [Mycobacterium scrofulaceum]|uniref:hypothetical protein n=1 Tax=Mycobacterium scrofulaceum TaxID=1783 RepID=UPI000A9B43B5|nr:hypothetical protein [Mycobacterium scrofulaceum]
MTRRWLFMALVVATAVMTGCSSSKPASSGSSPAASSGSTTAATSSTTTASSDTSAANAPAAATLDSSQCVDVTGANVDLLAASDKDAARKAADTLERYNPPASVKDAIEHFVTTGGAHFDDPDYTKNNKTVDGWVKQVCPS